VLKPKPWYTSPRIPSTISTTPMMILPFNGPSG
jgi:hypothetical protein